MRLVNKLTAILLMVFLLDFAIGNMLRYFYFKQVSGLYYRTTYAMDSTQADILIFGSSRASHHYVPEVFEDSLKMSFYNTGRDGNFLLFNYAVFKAILSRYTPKIILFDVNDNELLKNTADYERLSSLLPYYKNHPEIRNIINLRSPYEKTKLISSIYPFNSMFLTIAIGNLNLNKERKVDRKGYVPLHNTMLNTTLYYSEDSKGETDNIKIKALKKIIHMCREREIQLYFVNSPVYSKEAILDSIGLVGRIIIEEKATYWSYTKEPLFLENPEYFQDIAHLNDDGAKLFTKILVNRIKDNMTKNTNGSLYISKI